MAGQTPRQGPPRKGAPAGRQPTRSAAPGKKAAPQRKPPAPNKPNFAGRRLIAFLVLAGLVALFVWGVISIVSFVRDSIAQNEAASEVVPTDAPFTDQPTACDPGVVEWVISAQPGSAGERVPFRFTITNSGEIPCLVDAGATSLVINVTSGDDEIWSNAHCSSDEVALLLGAGDSTEREVTWGGGRSAPGCATVEATPEPGTYKVEMTYNGATIPEGTMVFDLR